MIITLILQVSTTYRAFALASMIAEANVAVERLNLPEDRPITEAKLKMVHVPPASFSQAHGGVTGSIETSRFLYAFARDGRLSSLGRLDLLNTARTPEKDLLDEYKRRAIAPEQVDTNAAWKLMVPRLQAGFLNLDRLNRDCSFSLRNRRHGRIQLPIYTARWSRDGEDVALLTILLPENAVIAMRIEDPAFSLRPTVPIPPQFLDTDNGTNRTREAQSQQNVHAAGDGTVEHHGPGRTAE